MLQPHSDMIKSCNFPGATEETYSASQREQMHTSSRNFLPASPYKRQQAAISRGKLYPATAFYTTFAAIILFLGLRTDHPYKALFFFLLGLPLWTLTEYTSHRWIFHKHWKMSKRKYKKYFTYLSHKYLDPTHFGHHERPFDGEHINGPLKDLLPVFLFLLPLSLLFSIYTMPMLL